MSLLMKSCLLMVLCTLAVSTRAQPRPMEEGSHYVSIAPPIATGSDADTIEVLDVFWYGCPLCMEFEPMMTYYGGEIRGDLTMRRMPAIWNAAMRTHARVYFTAVALELAPRAHPAAFRYVQEQKLPLNTMEQAQTFFGTLGVTAEDFATAWQSDAVTGALQKAEADTLAAGIDRVPALVVNGQYRVIRNEFVPELPELVITANQLIRNLRDKRRVD